MEASCPYRYLHQHNALLTAPCAQLTGHAEPGAQCSVPNTWNAPFFQPLLNIHRHGACTFVHTQQSLLPAELKLACACRKLRGS